MGEWLNKLQYIPVMDYYSTIKRNEKFIRSRTRMNLQRIMVNGKVPIPKVDVPQNFL